MAKRDMEAKSPKGTKIERELWHGTSSDALLNINTSGFNRSHGANMMLQYDLTMVLCIKMIRLWLEAGVPYSRAG